MQSKILFRSALIKYISKHFPDVNPDTIKKLSIEGLVVMKLQIEINQTVPCPDGFKIICRLDDIHTDRHVFL